MRIIRVGWIRLIMSVLMSFYLYSAISEVRVACRESLFLLKKNSKKFVGIKKNLTFATAFREMLLVIKDYAEIAQLVEHDLAKVGVAGSSPVFRSTC